MSEKQFELVGEDEPTPEKPPAQEPITFGAFVLSLSTSALLSLGVSPDDGLDLSEVGEPTLDLALAKQTIDILEMIRDKTRGNLDADEKRLIDHALHDLHVRFVEAKRDHAASTTQDG